MNAAPKNQLTGRGKSGGIGGLMAPATIISLVMVGLFAFAALIVLSGFADNWRDKDNGLAHPFSRSAIGFNGLAQLLEASGTEVIYDRSNLRGDRADDAPYALKVITLTRPISKPLSEKFDLDEPTLIVMPKWFTSPMRETKGWRRKLAPPLGPYYDLENFHKALPDSAGEVTFKRATDIGETSYAANPQIDSFPSYHGIKVENLQTLDGDNFNSIITLGPLTVLAQIHDTPVYILSDPDLLNTQGISSWQRAYFATELLRAIADIEGYDTDIVSFDMTLHGFGSTDNVIKTLFTPPFLAATLCLMAAGVLIGWQAFARFGDPKKAVPDYALGKSTLADNAARFIKIAQRETKMAPGYVNLMRRRAARDLNLSGLSEADIDRIIARRGESLDLAEDWQAVTAATKAAPDKYSLLSAARALYDWKQEISHDRK